jgi:hypothetical protein
VSRLEDRAHPGPGAAPAHQPALIAGAAAEPRVATPQAEAASLLLDVLRDLQSSDHDLKLVLRRCILICTLMGWEPARHWFHRELHGYASDADLPPHRIVRGVIQWHMNAGVEIALESAVRRMHRTVPDPAPEPTTLRVWADLAWVQARAQSGYVEPTGETRTEFVSRRRTDVQVEQVRVFDASAFARVLESVAGLAFDWATRQYALIQYGDAVADIWAGFRREVEVGLQKLGLSLHLQTVHDGMRSQNPETWRSVVLACRNLLTDIGDALWKDPRPTYVHLPGRDTKDGKLDVTRGKAANRLSAYLHQRGFVGAEGKFSRDEIERLATSIRSLIGEQSEAHHPVTLDQARAVVIDTYRIVREIVSRTDLVPVTQYGDPAPVFG